jgi:hypothetical protein
MKDNILRLVEDDIKFNRLVTTLRKIGIEAEAYTTNNVHVIFDLMHVPKSELVMQAYFTMIETSGDLERYYAKEKLKQLSCEVFEFLLKFSELKHPIE